MLETWYHLASPDSSPERKVETSFRYYGLARRGLPIRRKTAEHSSRSSEVIASSLPIPSHYKNPPQNASANTSHGHHCISSHTYCTPYAPNRMEFLCSRFSIIRGIKGFRRVYEDALRYRHMITPKALERARILAFWEKYGLAVTLEAFPKTKRRTLFLWKRRFSLGRNKIDALSEKKRTQKQNGPENGIRLFLGKFVACVPFIRISARKNFTPSWHAFAQRATSPSLRSPPLADSSRIWGDSASFRRRFPISEESHKHIAERY